MVEITGKIEKIKTRKIKVEPLGNIRKIYFLEETLKSVEHDSPVCGLIQEKVYATFVYCGKSETEISNKLKKVQAEREKQGWRVLPIGTILELEFGDNYYSRYRLEYKILEKEVIKNGI